MVVVTLLLLSAVAGAMPSASATTPGERVLATADWWVDVRGYNGQGDLADLSGHGHPARVGVGDTEPPRWVPRAQETSRCLYTDGGWHSGASTPDSDRISPTGDLDIRADIQPDEWRPLDANAFGTKWVDGTIDSYEVGTWAEFGVFFEWTSTDLEEHMYAIPHPTDPHARLSFRFTLDVDDGAGHHVVTAYRQATVGAAGTVRTADGAAWRRVKRWVLPGVTDVYDSPRPLTISGQADGGAGRTCRLQLFDGIDGEQVIDLYPARDARWDDRTWVSRTSGERWSLEGGARFYGPQRVTGRHLVISSRGALTVTDGPLADLDWTRDATFALAFRPHSDFGSYFRRGPRIASTDADGWGLFSEGDRSGVGFGTYVGDGGPAQTATWGGRERFPLVHARSTAVLRFDADTRQLEIFVNGESSAAVTLEHGAGGSRGPAVFDGPWASWDFFGAAVWNRTLTDAEVAAVDADFRRVALQP